MIPEESPRVLDFMETHIYPNEQQFYRQSADLGPWKVPPIVEDSRRWRGPPVFGTCS